MFGILHAHPFNTQTMRKIWATIMMNRLHRIDFGDDESGVIDCIVNYCLPQDMTSTQETGMLQDRTLSQDSIGTPDLTFQEICSDLYNMQETIQTSVTAYNGTTTACLKTYEVDMTLHTCLLIRTEMRAQTDLTSHATTDQTGADNTSDIQPQRHDWQNGQPTLPR